MTAKPDPRLVRLSDLLTEWDTASTAAHIAYRTGQPAGPVTGLDKLDRELGGFLAPGVHLLHGQSGTGKTALALQIAGETGCPALFVTCEMSALEIVRRHTARITKTRLSSLKSGELAPSVANALLVAAIAKAPDLTIADATLAYADSRWIQEAAEDVRGNHPHILVVLDSIHAWVDGGPQTNEYEAINAGLYDLLALANTLTCPVLVVAERNRASMAAGGTSAAAGSRKLEYKSATVFDLERDGKGDADAAGEIRVTVTLPKNRASTPNGKVPLRFNGAHQSFRQT